MVPRSTTHLGFCNKYRKSNGTRVLGIAIRMTGLNFDPLGGVLGIAIRMTGWVFSYLAVGSLNIQNNMLHPSLIGREEIE
jgi:hypothetical protein